MVVTDTDVAEAKKAADQSVQEGQMTQEAADLYYDKYTCLYFRSQYGTWGVGGCAIVLNGHPELTPLDILDGAIGLGQAGAKMAGLIGTIKLSRLGTEARQTLGNVINGGQYPYPDKDHTIYKNLSGALPKEEYGYYHEYTIPIPGVSNRGARRFVIGQGGEIYYTEDHYNTFYEVIDR